MSHPLPHPPPEVLVNDCHSDVLPANNSDSEVQLTQNHHFSCLRDETRKMKANHPTSAVAFLSQIISGAYIWHGWLVGFTLTAWCYNVYICRALNLCLSTKQPMVNVILLFIWKSTPNKVSCILYHDLFQKFILVKIFPSAPDQLRTFRIALNLFIEDTLLADRFSVFLRVITDIHDLLS